MLRGGFMGAKGLKPAYDTVEWISRGKGNWSVQGSKYQKITHNNMQLPNALKATEGFIQGISDVAQGAYRMEKANLDFKNYQRNIQGKNLDAMTQSNLISTDDASYINTFASLSPMSVMYKSLKPSDCNSIWWNAHINGYNVNRTFNFNNYDNRTYFNYLQVSDISPSILRTRDIPMIYKDWFITKFENGIRLWKTWYDYKLDNKEVFVDRIDNVVIGV